MENTPSPEFQNNPQSQQGAHFIQVKNLPNSVAVLVLGICSIFPGCFCAGVVGIICGIIALVLSKKDFTLYKNNPENYSLSSYNNLKAGRICAIIGLSLSTIVLLIYVVYILIIGAAISMAPWGMMN